MAVPKSSPIRLVETLRALPAGELDSLASRLGTTIDTKKRVDAPVQVARVIVSLPELRDLSRLPLSSAQLLHRIAEAGGVLVAAGMPSALEPLAARGFVYARGNAERRIELLLPSSLLVQIPPWEGEDPRGVRALLAQASYETQTAIASHYHGKPVVAPVALPLEEAWEVLSNPESLKLAVDELAMVERRLLEAIEREGGEVDTEELLDLEREPLRLRNAGGATPSRRGVGFALERRGMLMPVHPNRHVIPTEVARVIGAARATERESKRAQIRAFVKDSDYEPRRARFAADPVPLTLALMIAAREPGAEVREGIGTPKSLVQRMAQRFGREPEAVAILTSLSRAIGLWDSAAVSRAMPPGSLCIAELGPLLFGTWRKGGAWDEARPDPEVIRIASDARDPSPVGVLRDIVLDALSELGEGRWVPWEVLADYVRTDARSAGVTRLMRRWAERASLEAPSPTDVARRMVLESLPTLGLIDLGDADYDDETAQDLGPMLRVTSRGRAVLFGDGPSLPRTPSEFTDPESVRVGTAATVASVVALCPLVEIGRVSDSIELVLNSASIGRAIASGLESKQIRSTIEALCAPSESLVRLLDQASVVLGRSSYVPVSAFLWCDDAEVREMLRTRRQTAELFVDPSPPGGLLVACGKDLDLVTRRCRGLGVEVLFDGSVVRAKSTMPPGRDWSPPRRASTKPPAAPRTPRSKPVSSS